MNTRTDNRDTQRDNEARPNITIRARDIMSRNIISISPETDIQRIARLLSEEHISAVPVINDGAIIGIVSEGDLLNRRELGTEYDNTSSQDNSLTDASDVNATSKAHGLHARDVMTSNIVSVSEETPLREVVKALQYNHVRRVLVTQDNQLIGVVSRADIMRALAARPHGSQGPSGRDDDMIRYHVIAILLSIPGTSPWATDVKVANGIVELEGNVENELVRDPSRIAIQAIPHVREVKDRRVILQPY